MVAPYSFQAEILPLPNYFPAILVKSVADRIAEALAEWVHLQFRLNMGSTERFTTDELISESYRGIRPAPGYAACPDH